MREAHSPTTAACIFRQVSQGTPGSSSAVVRLSSEVLECDLVRFYLRDDVLEVGQEDLADLLLDIGGRRLGAGLWRFPGFAWSGAIRIMAL